MKRITNLMQAHSWIQKHGSFSLSVVDMTCGNGHDTEFLAQHFHQVIAIDIQPIAIENTKKRTESYANITYICSDHSAIDISNFTPLSGAIFNLGYLPSGDKVRTTHASTTLQALNNILDLAQDFIVVTCYPGHDAGLIETKAVQAWIQEKELEYTRYAYDTPRSPITYCIHLSHTEMQQDHGRELNDPRVLPLP